MKSLIIVAHPNKNSFSHILAHEYSTAKKKSWQEVRLIDLYDTEWKQEFLTMDETNRQPETPLRQQHQELITWSDEICFFFPLWWFDCPAILKNWFDNNYSSGFAFKYVSGKAMPEKLLKGKSVRVFVTAGWPWLLYNTLWRLIITLPWYLGKINYVGMKLKSWTWFTEMNKYKTPESRLWMKEKVRKMGS